MTTEIAALALVSECAGRAVIRKPKGKEEQFLLMLYDDVALPTVVEAAYWSQLRWADPDAVILDPGDFPYPALRERLSMSRKRLQSVELLLICLDPEHSEKIRISAARAVEQLLKDVELFAAVSAAFAGHDAPEEADLQGACSLAERMGCLAVGRLFEDQRRRTEPMRMLRDTLSVALRAVGRPDQRARIAEAIERQRLLAKATDEVVLRGQAATRDVIGHLVVRELMPMLPVLRPQVAMLLARWSAAWPREDGTKRILVSEPDETRGAPRRRGREAPKAFEQKARVDRQKDAIVEALEKGRDLVARDYTDELVADQLESDGSEFAAKSLSALAATAESLGRNKFATYCLARAVELAPSDVVARHHWITLQRRLGNVRELVEASERLRTLAPSDVYVWTGHGEVLRRVGRMNDALVAYEQAVESFPYEVFARTGRAETLRSLGRLNEALAAYEEAIEQFPENVVAQAGRAETLRSFGRLNDAFMAYNEVISLFPDSVVARSGRAETLRSLGRLNEALAAYDESIVLFPANSVARSGRAETLRSLGRSSEALAAYDQVIGMSQENVIARCGRAETLRSLGRLKDALVAYNQIIKQFPEYVIAYNGRAETLRSLGRLDDALVAYNQTIGQFPEDVVARNGRAETLRSLGRLGDALAAYDQIRLDFSFNIVAATALADLLRRSKKWDEALEAYRVLGESYPNDGRIRCGRAYCLAGLHDYDSALEIVRRNVVPQSEEDWYLRRADALISLRSGQARYVCSILASIDKCVFLDVRRDLDGILGAALLHVGDVQLARDRLEEQVQRSAFDTVRKDLFIAHAYAELGETHRAHELLRHKTAWKLAPIATLKELLPRRYGLLGSVPDLSPSIAAEILYAEVELLEMHELAS